MSDKIFGSFWDISVYKSRHDNHGNIQHGRMISCADGQVIDYTAYDRRSDSITINMAEGPFGFWDGEVDLGNIQSPLQTRCQQAAESKGQGI